MSAIREMLVFITGVLFVTLSLSSHAAEHNWDLSYDKDGLKVYTRSVDGSPFKEFRGEIVVEQTLGTLVTLLWNTDDMPQWMYGCKKAEAKESEGELSRKLYLLSSAPFPLKDRDMVIRNTVTQDPASLAVRYSMDLLEYPLKTRNVHVPVMKGFVDLIPEGPNKTKVIYQAHLEAGGAVPGWVANVVVAENPVQTLLGAKTILSRKHYPDHPLIKNQG